MILLFRYSSYACCSAGARNVGPAWEGGHRNALVFASMMICLKVFNEKQPSESPQLPLCWLIRQVTARQLSTTFYCESGTHTQTTDL